MITVLCYIDVHCTESEKSQFHFLCSLFMLRADFLVTAHVVVEKTCINMRLSSVCSYVLFWSSIGVSFLTDLSYFRDSPECDGQKW